MRYIFFFLNKSDFYQNCHCQIAISAPTAIVRYRLGQSIFSEISYQYPLRVCVCVGGQIKTHILKSRTETPKEGHMFEKKQYFFYHKMVLSLSLLLFYMFDILKNITVSVQSVNTMHLL